MSKPEYLFVKFHLKNNPKNHHIGGDIINIDPPHKDEANRGTKEDGSVGHTKVPFDKTIWNEILTGQKTIDIEKSTSEKGVLADRPDLIRIEATSIVSMKTEEWKKSPHFNLPASKSIYVNYIKEFLNEFTRLTRHIPIKQQIEYFPNAWLFPSLTNIYVGRDGIAFDYDYPARPDKAKIKINIGKIVENLLLPHKDKLDYLSYGPNKNFNSICDDSHYIHQRGMESGVHLNYHPLGNPNFLILERQMHLFIENINIARPNGDNTTEKKELKFVEIFGDISKENFTSDKARSRARIYAESLIANKISNGNLGTGTELRSKFDEFKRLVERDDVSEPELERFLDSQQWILLRGLGYKKYHSQITIKAKYLSRSDYDIRPDKFLEREDGYCDILDLKKPSAKILKGQKNRVGSASQLNDARDQIDKYTELANEPLARNELRKKEIKVLKPRGIVIIGRTDPSETEKWIDAKNRLGIEAYSYDELINKIETIISWVEKITVAK